MMRLSPAAMKSRQMITDAAVAYLRKVGGTAPKMEIVRAIEDETRPARSTNGKPGHRMNVICVLRERLGVEFTADGRTYSLKTS